MKKTGTLATFGKTPRGPNAVCATGTERTDTVGGQNALAFISSSSYKGLVFPDECVPDGTGVAVRGTGGISQSGEHRPWTGSTAREGFGTGTDSEGPDIALVAFVRPPSFNVSFDRSKGDTGEIGNGTGTVTGPDVPVTNTAVLSRMSASADGGPVVKPIRRGRADSDIGTVEGVLGGPMIYSTLLSATLLRFSKEMVSGTPGGRTTGAADVEGGGVLGATLMSGSFGTLTPGVGMVTGPGMAWVAAVRTPCIRTSQVPFHLSLMHFEGGLAIVKVVNRARKMGGTDDPPAGPTGGVWVRR